MTLIPVHFPDCVVAIGIRPPSSGQTIWIASGFMYGEYAQTDEEGKKLHVVWLVTNRHVFQDLQSVTLRFNPSTNEPAREYPLGLVENGKQLWTAHPESDIDVAVIPINFGLLMEQGIKASAFTNDHDVAQIDRLNQEGIAEGDFVYVLGFPLGLVGETRNVVISRSGCIAKIGDALAKTSKTFLIDASVFPGNSGGPVILKPELFAIQGTKSHSSAYLIGVVKSYIGYQDVAVSQQTKKARIIFEENSGLAEVHPIDFVEEAIKEHRRLFPPRDQPKTSLTG